MKHFMPLPIKINKKTSGLLHHGAAVLFWIIIWQMGAMMVNSDLILPSPITTVKTLITLMAEPDFLLLVGSTLTRVFGGILLFSVLAIVLGILSGLYQPLEILLKPLASITRTLPVVSVIILLNLWLKSDTVPLMVTFLMCFPILWTNTVTGIRETDPLLLEMAAVYQLGFWKKIKGIFLPSVKPYITSAFISAIGLSWKATITAEVLANTQPSVGMSLYYSKVYLETPVLFAWTFLLIMFSLVIEWGTKALLKRGAN